MKCSKCGKEIANDSNFCEYCGDPIIKSHKNVMWIALVVILFSLIIIVVLSGALFGEKVSQCDDVAEVLVEETPIDEVQPVDNVAEVQEKERAERMHVDDLKSQGWIDLGLPSGTLWKDKNEEDGFYTESQIAQFGRNLPTKKQFEELINSCQWNWKGDGYRVVGPNGESITLAALGATKCWGEEYLVGICGFYWSSTPDGPDAWWDLYFSADRVEMFSNSRCDESTNGGHSVRLIK